MQISLTDLENYKSTVEIPRICPICSCSFTRTVKYLRYQLRAGRKIFTCSKKCRDSIRSKEKITKICKNCGDEFTKEGNNYCSQKCANSSQERMKTYRKKTKICKTCNDLIYSDRTYCPTCFKNRIDLKRIEDIATKTGNKCSQHSYLRSLARQSLKKSGRIFECQFCKYSKYLECAHIKPVSSFPMNTLVSVVNNLSNLVWLCPNCHKEHDESIKTWTQQAATAPFRVKSIPMCELHYAAPLESTFLFFKDSYKFFWWNTFGYSSL